MYANEDDDSDERALSATDDEIGFVAIKEEILEKCHRLRRNLVG